MCPRRESIFYDSLIRFRNVLFSHYEIILPQNLKLKKSEVSKIKIEIVNQEFLQKGGRVVLPKEFLANK